MFHIHRYRLIPIFKFYKALEFHRDEFLHILALIKSIDEDAVRRFDFKPYGYEYKVLVETHDLPATTEWNDRLVIERQVGGHFHIHYRNMRIELHSLTELGFPDNFRKDKRDQHEACENRYAKKILAKLWRSISFEQLVKDKSIIIDDDVLRYNNNLSSCCFLIENKVRLKDLRGSLLTPDGKNWSIHEIPNLPEYEFLIGNGRWYEEYCLFKNKELGIDKKDSHFHSRDRYTTLIQKLDAEGYDPRYAIFVDAKNVIVAGKHRACWLYKKYGGMHRIRIVRILTGDLFLFCEKNAIYWQYYRYKIFLMFTFGKKRKHYKAKRDSFHEKVRKIRKLYKKIRAS